MRKRTCDWVSLSFSHDGKLLTAFCRISPQGNVHLSKTLLLFNSSVEEKHKRCLRTLSKYVMNVGDNQVDVGAVGTSAVLDCV